MGEVFAIVFILAMILMVSAVGITAFWSVVTIAICSIIGVMMFIALSALLTKLEGNGKNGE